MELLLKKNDIPDMSPILQKTHFRHQLQNYTSTWNPFHQLCVLKEMYHSMGISFLGAKKKKGDGKVITFITPLRMSQPACQPQ